MVQFMMIIDKRGDKAEAYPTFVAYKVAEFERVRDTQCLNVGKDYQVRQGKEWSEEKALEVAHGLPRGSLIGVHLIFGTAARADKTLTDDPQAKAIFGNPNTKVLLVLQKESRFSQALLVSDGEEYYLQGLSSDPGFKARHG
jgi:hypothetical protein